MKLESSVVDEARRNLALPFQKKMRESFLKSESVIYEARSNLARPKEVRAV